MTTALAVVAVVLMLLGLVGVVLPAMPGPPLTFSGVLLLAWAYGFERISVVTVVALGVLTLLLVVVDVAASAAGARRFGGTWRGALGAAIGTVAGLAFGPFGILVGCLGGAVVGELIGGKASKDALRAGGGALLGLLAGALIKGAACVAMIATALVTHFW